MLKSPETAKACQSMAFTNFDVACVCFFSDIKIPKTDSLFLRLFSQIVPNVPIFSNILPHVWEVCPYSFRFSHSFPDVYIVSSHLPHKFLIVSHISSDFFICPMFFLVCSPHKIPARPRCHSQKRTVRKWSAPRGGPTGRPQMYHRSGVDLFNYLYMFYR